jgi:hypothetical protein
LNKRNKKESKSCNVASIVCLVERRVDEERGKKKKKRIITKLTRRTISILQRTEQCSSLQETQFPS